MSRSLFKRDRLTYAVHLVHLLQPHLFGEHEWELLSGTLLVEPAQASMPPWASPDRAPAFASLVAALPATAQALDLQSGQWAQWAASDKCEAEFPHSLPPSVTPFQRVLAVQALRPDRLQAALFHFASTSMGTASLSNPNPYPNPNANPNPNPNPDPNPNPNPSPNPKPKPKPKPNQVRRQHRQVLRHRHRHHRGQPPLRAPLRLPALRALPARRASS